MAEDEHEEEEEQVTGKLMRWLIRGGRVYPGTGLSAQVHDPVVTRARAGLLDYLCKLRCGLVNARWARALLLRVCWNV